MDLKLNVDTISSTDTYGKFIFQPLDRGFGITLGNALRRVLLTSIPGAAITNVKMDGVLHEFSTIKGIKEDVADIIMNLKGIRFKLFENNPTRESKPKIKITPRNPIDIAINFLKVNLSSFVVKCEMIKAKIGATDNNKPAVLD